MAGVFRQIISWILQTIMVMAFFILSIYGHRKMSWDRPRLWTVVVLLIFCGLFSLTTANQIRSAVYSKMIDTPTLCDAEGSRCQPPMVSLVLTKMGHYVSCSGLLLLLFFIGKVLVPLYM